MREVASAMDSLQQRELRARMQLQQRDSVERLLADARGREANAPVFLREDSVELATASLARRLETVVAEASPGNRSCAISNRSPGVARQSSERFQRVAVRVRMRCGSQELAKVLHALEGGSPVLFIEHLNVIALARAPMRNGAARPGDGGLDVEFELHGFLRPNPARRDDDAT